MKIFSVSDITRAVKDVLETEFPFVWIKGQVTNLSRPASGHIYFTLTDGDAGINVVWFKGNQAQSSGSEESRVNPLTGEVETGNPLVLEDGMEVLCAGHINVYPPRGVYQLIVELVQEQGVGDLRLAFEAMKKNLAERGYFDEDRKMELPRSPGRVAVVTAKTGAAIHDFLRIADERGTGTEIRIYPSLVQGDRAPEQIASAIDLACDDGWADVLVLIRGGGSLEDLWAFNTEKVAEALYRATIPVVCGVGHEVDVSIADYVADKRVATPSHAAQLLWPRRQVLMQSVDEMEFRLVKEFKNFIETRSSRFESLKKGLMWLSPVQRMERLGAAFDTELMRLQSAFKIGMARKESELERLRERLSLSFGPGSIDALSSSVELFENRLLMAMDHRMLKSENSLNSLSESLRLLDPEKPLERGYSLVRIEKSGKFLRDPDEVDNGEMLAIRVRSGEVRARVKKNE
ncbi:exodeoxyribonuclease VII large subunit [Maridesulfovibrio bastinii]|uniref:exodeoxyribonuclease VII large subunit n=1 Tax=Maridesulfovibrio bastinii TaxID=47157 RepID=UPI00041C85C7|nr:exodeoxyribonuclease VII large subunit [Maridesulfovibrio bastinii]